LEEASPSPESRSPVHMQMPVISQLEGGYAI
jgi:hypothetical protein